ncbi:S-layer homology domain-containing protein [Paenibacillus chitinolyticus]|uniref:S-layer homology domain-containing protein n=1 Tax=Paenibacillus chitinolyticus TaxID=79263 RepID=UPI0036DB6A3C
MNKAQFTAWIVRALNCEVKPDAPFKGGFLDVHLDDWFIPELTAAYEAGIFEGHSPERFAPGDVINRGQTAKIVRTLFRKEKPVMKGSRYNLRTKIRFQIGRRPT